MTWMRLIAITLGAGIVSSLTDWFSLATGFTERFTYQEIWRPRHRSERDCANEPPSISDQCESLRMPLQGWDSLFSGYNGICWRGLDDRSTSRSFSLMQHSYRSCTTCL